MLSEEVASREFPDWEMAHMSFDNLDRDHQKTFIDIQNLRDTDPMRSMTDDSDTKALLDIFLSSFNDLHDA